MAFPERGLLYSKLHFMDFLYIKARLKLTSLSLVKQVASLKTCETPELNDLLKHTDMHLFLLLWRHIGRDSVSNHQPYDCLLNGLFKLRSKKTWKLRVTGLGAGKSPETGEFPAQMASNAENVSSWWRHHGSGVWFTIGGDSMTRTNVVINVSFFYSFLICIEQSLITTSIMTAIFN